MNALTNIALLAPQTGILHDLPIEAYHAGTAISCSGLHDFARSPAHYHALHLDPKRPPRETTASQLDGTLAHCAILEPAEFGKRYAIGPQASRATRQWKEFEASTKLQAIKPDQYDAALAQAVSVRQLPDVAELLASGRAEVSAFWVDPETGEYCRCRPDWVHPVGESKVILVDVKTFGDARPAEFARQVPRMGYHRQAAWYSDGYALAADVEVLAFIFLAVETSWPFASCPAMLDDDSLEQGRRENRALLDRYAECKRSDTWPGYSSRIELITLPSWAKEKTQWQIPA